MNLTEIKPDDNEVKYTRKYWGTVIAELLFELKVYDLLKINPKEVPNTKDIAVEIK